MSEYDTEMAPAKKLLRELLPNLTPDVWAVVAFDLLREATDYAARDAEHAQFPLAKLEILLDAAREVSNDVQLHQRKTLHDLLDEIV